MRLKSLATDDRPSANLSNLFYFAMPRVTKADLESQIADLERENVLLTTELEQRRERSRSRSRRRKVVAAPMDATTRRALDVVRKHDRDGVIEEQRATIARQAQDNAALRNGSGSIGHVLVANWRGPMTDGLRAKILENRETVGAFIRRVRGMLFDVDSELSVGYKYGY